MGSDIDWMRLPRIEVASHRRALGKALGVDREEMAAEGGTDGTRRSGIRHRGGLRMAIAAAAIALGLAAVLVFTLVGWPGGGGSGVTVLTESQALAARVEARATGFDFSLFRRVAQEDGAANILVSPLSARLALAMAYNGASDEVAEEMAYVLDFGGMSLGEVNAMMRDLLASLRGADPAVQLEVANSIWSGNEVSFLADFRDRCVESYDAEVANLDLDDPAAAGTIDAWVSDKTHGKIPEIAGSFDLEDIETMLINALYLKGVWTAPFDPGQTESAPFYLAGGGTKQVPMMHQAGEYDYYEDDDFQAVSLPYGGGRLSMYIFLPREGVGLDDFVQTLNRNDWERWMEAFASRNGAIGLPRFYMEYAKDLNPTLSSLGMGSAFLGDAFPRMAAAPPLWIDRVVQKTYMDVTEEGTEAAASTGIILWNFLDPSEQHFTMAVNRPFFFAIRDNQAGTLLFMGSVYEP